MMVATLPRRRHLPGHERGVFSPADVGVLRDGDDAISRNYPKSFARYTEGSPIDRDHAMPGGRDNPKRYIWLELFTPARSWHTDAHMENRVA